MSTCSMFSRILLVVLSTSSVAVNAAPFPSQNSLYALWPWIQQHQTQPTPPSSSLPAPASSLSLQYVAIGMGTQNYTCSSTSATPVAAGAMANLYDATPIVSAQGILGTMSTSNLACLADQTNNNLGLNQIGVHYFNANNIPTFDLTKAGKNQWLQATKMAAAAAPSGACTGRSGDGAVAWLFLQQDGSGVSRGLSAVYRLNTAGGNAVSCANAINGWVTDDYAAEYWFYQ